MAHYYRTTAGDTLDWICWKYYTQQVNFGSAAMAVDPQLAENKSLLEGGILQGGQLEDQTNLQVEAVLKANPILANYPPNLPAGVNIVLPDLTPETQQDQFVKLWD
ncbi:tail protein X [Marinibactrum halimedae]|uniref:Phage tail protein n=1 Tax=Marinibactrum halimedae TaxID=1444977 RepID=A0AA37T7V4_9GAMM|nr:tail protein X [Marinibactrum halimedae]MCD9460788.1 tail protein X [Marinibactrum halimedae]GLS27376.1 hypothetical protein GCM10007877_30950 [Marinibactrum halimedae]